MIILLHTSKTMRSLQPSNEHMHTPQLLDTAIQMATYLQSLSKAQLMKAMHLSPLLGTKTEALLANWNTKSTHQSLAIDSFIGDIYSGLRADTLNRADRDYADKHLRILSGLYGILRPYDGIYPYRLEMGYKLPDSRYKDLYKLWGNSIAQSLPTSSIIINLASVEYSRAVLPFVEPTRVITPKFLTIDPKTKEATFVVVHAKIARGAFARWLITTKIQTADRLMEFADIGYQFDASQSTPNAPVFICEEFTGKGLSMRLQK